MANWQRVNPATGAVISTVECERAGDLTQRMSRAKLAQQRWQDRPLSERAACLERFRVLLGESVAAAARIQSEETGKPISQARGEIQATDARITWLVEAAAKYAAPVHAADAPVDTREEMTWDPLGVIANISAWNYPYFVGTNVFVPALVLGNAVLYKPSEYALGTGLHIGKLMAEAGVPEDVFQVVVGAGDTGKALVECPVDGLFFTGSYGTGRAIHRALDGRMLPAQFELGGKDPVYIRNDMDPAAAAASVGDGAFYNAGQSCCAVERIYVHESIYAEFVDHLVKFAEQLTIGDPLDDNTYLGPLTRRAQLDVCAEQVEDALARGGQVLTGGTRWEQNDAYFEPTVIGKAHHEMKLMTDETFGPLIGVMPVSGDDEAVELMNDTSYGLTAGVFTQDETVARGIMSQLQAGTVYWNCCDRVSPRIPWSGRGHSGLGWTLGFPGVQALVRPKAWHLRPPAG